MISHASRSTQGEFRLTKNDIDDVIIKTDARKDGAWPRKHKLMCLKIETKGVEPHLAKKQKTVHQSACAMAQWKREAVRRKTLWLELKRQSSRDI